MYIAYDSKSLFSCVLLSFMGMIFDKHCFTKTHKNEKKKKTAWLLG
jgi:hypothetical protein